ncbi:MAG: YybH family protein, partial [Actinomycetota bacterium]
MADVAVVTPAAGPTDAAVHGAPAEGVQAFEDAFNAGDVDLLVGMYEPGAVLVTGPGEEARGSDALRGALTELLDIMHSVNGRFRLTRLSEHPVGDLTLETLEWKVDGAGPDGPVALGGLAAAVLRRQADGRWLLVVDHPYL